MATITTTARPGSSSAFRRFITRHPLVAYFTLAFAGFWGGQIPMLLSQDGLGVLPYTVPMLPAMLLFVLSTWAGPALAGLAVTAVEGGRADLYAYLRRFVRWRVGLRWYLVVLLGYPLLYLLAGTVFMGTAALQAVAENWPLLLTSYLPSLVLFQGITQWDIGGESRTGARVSKKSKISAVGCGSAISGASSESSQGAGHVTSATSALLCP